MGRDKFQVDGASYKRQTWYKMDFNDTLKLPIQSGDDQDRYRLLLILS